MRLVLAFSLLLCASLTAAQTRLLRMPDVHDDQVAFVYAGDIYTADISGGTAMRLTSHEGIELFPKFSPDGSQIAFSAEYNGTRQLYVMPATGGEPRQLTWYNDVGAMPPRGGFDYRVLDWSADGEHILVRANRLPWGERMGRYYLVPVIGGMEKPLEIPEGGGGMFSPDGKRIVYTPIDREFRTWKRYRGGRAQDVWIYDLEQHSAEQITDSAATDNQPLWVGDDIFFTSDRDYTLNLYRVIDGATPQKVTSHEDFDVLWPSAGPDAVVYENGGWIYYMSASDSTTRRLDVEVVSDRAGRLPRYVEASEFIQSADISPNGQGAVFAARGELFTVPATGGSPRNVSLTPESREIDVTWSADGKRLAFLSDATGEYEIYLHDLETSETTQLTRNGAIWRFPPQWSPDSNWLAFADKTQTLFVVDANKGSVSALDQSQHNDITDYVWAPDSTHIGYVKNNDAGYASIWVASVDGGDARQVTTDDTNDFSPAFDPMGRYLYFLSNRDFNLDFSALEFDYQYEDATRVYAAMLTADAPALNRPKSGWEDEESKDEKDETDSDEEAPFAIDFSGINGRVVALQEQGGNYQSVTATGQGPVYLVQGDNGSSDLTLFDLKKEEEQVVLKAINDYRLAADGKHVLFQASDKWGIAELKADQDSSKGHLALADMELRIDPAVEWQQMYVDGWRILRDWFYDPGMHGMDWPAVREKYAPLVDHVAHRTDLDYVFGEIAGEMNAGHIYVQNGDQPTVERRDGGLLGATIVAESGGFRVADIFAGEAWQEAFRSPLAEPGVDVSEGDFIVAVDGVAATSVDNFYQLLENKGGKTVTLLVNDNASAKGAREVRVRTVTSETNLRYLDWVESRRRMVDEMSGGRVGYLHLPNTAQDGNRELFKRYLPQINKDAIILDARYNGGGFIPDRMIELVSRTPLNYWKRRGLDPQATPGVSHDGPKAVLINGYSSSGGDAFPYYFRKLGLGPLIGTRTWGGLIGISGNPMLADGGGILASTFRFMGTDGDWAVENEGVAPDIEVLDRPDLVAKGEDPTLKRAVEEMLKALETNPPAAVDAPPAPSQFP